MTTPLQYTCSKNSRFVPCIGIMKGFSFKLEISTFHNCLFNFEFFTPAVLFHNVRYTYYSYHGYTHLFLCIIANIKVFQILRIDSHFIFLYTTSSLPYHTALTVDDVLNPILCFDLQEGKEEIEVFHAQKKKLKAIS